MLLHPKDTQKVVRQANKQHIAHLAYHIHYLLPYKREQRKGRQEYLLEDKMRLSAVTVHPDLKTVANTVSQQREQAFVNLAKTYHVKKLKAKPIGKIIHGLGAGHVRETSLTIHPVYGIPYIPASSIKGVVRHWFIQAYCDGKEEKLPSNEKGVLVFGTQQQRGIVQFHDIFLINGLQITPDVLTVHMKDYYGKKGAATDTQSPNPVKFLTVTVSDVDIYVTGDAVHPKIGDTSALMEEVTVWTIRALTELGIGSKTSSGYGYFTDCEDVTETQFLPQVKKAKERQQQQVLLERKKEEEKRLAEMTPEDRLVYQIESLTDSPQDQEISKGKLYQEVLKAKSKKAAQALQAYWHRIGQWNVKSSKKKQYEKVQAIRTLLEN